jgi:hypothetical protein
MKVVCEQMKMRKLIVSAKKLLKNRLPPCLEEAENEDR